MLHGRDRPGPESGPRSGSWSGDELEHAVGRGAMAGVVAAMPAVALLLLAGATYRGLGLATPMYAVVGALDPTPLRSTLEGLGRGEPVPFRHQPFSVGVATCLMLGAVAGVVFAVGVVRRRLRDRRALLVLGPVYALCVLGVVVALAGLLGAGRSVFGLAGVVGWPTLVVTQLLYGCGLSWWAARRGADTAPPVPSWQRR